MVVEPPCGHGSAALLEKGYRLQCRRCKSFFDGDFAGQNFDYDASYPELRGHFDEATGEMKRRTFERWLDGAGIDLAGNAVCEVGFGGAHCLAFAAERAAQAFGIEAVPENLARARALGVPDVFPFDGRPDRLPKPVDIWVLLDSFEHLPEPAGVLDWMAANSAPGAKALVVAPEAGSTSERALGRLWPHKLPDHEFHWSRAGLVEIFERHGFARASEFHPGKYVSGAMLANHLRHKFPALALPGPTVKALARVRLYFNVGQMGLTFERAR